MKKIYITIFALAISFGAMAQKNIKSLDYSKNFSQLDCLANNEVINSNSSSVSSATNIIWESDFSDPSDWTIVTAGQNPPTYGWSIDPNSDGWWSANGISSTSGGNFAELSNGDPQAGTQAGAVIYTMTTAQPINVFDSIGSANATLSFEEYGARFYDLQEVQVSTDGVNFVAVADNQAYSQLTSTGGSAYANPTLREINISSYIGTTPTSVWIRFSWTSALNLATTDPNYYNTWIAYGWYIDDVKIAESAANRVTMEYEVIGGWHLDYQNFLGTGLSAFAGLDYSVTPLSQVQSHPYAIEAVFRNEGTQSQTVNLSYAVIGTASSTGSSNTSVLSPGDSIILGASFSPTVTGQYSVDIWGVADSVGAGVTTTLTNMETRDIEVSDYIYGKDLGLPTSGYTTVGGPSNQWHSLTRYEMYANEQLYSIRVYITDQSIVGAKIKAVIHEADSTSSVGVGGIAFLDESDDYTITAQDLGDWVNIPFVSPISLLSGYAYECGIAGSQHPTDSAVIGRSGSMMYPGEHSSWDELGLSAQSAGVATWYYSSSTPMIRMNFDPTQEQHKLLIV
jgi:hypothetical protein